MCFFLLFPIILSGVKLAIFFVFNEVDLLKLNCNTWRVPFCSLRLLGGWYVVITTDFSMENYKEFLTDALPHLDQMVVIEIDSASFT